MCMSRTNVDIDDAACAEVMRRYRLATKREAINYALRTLAAEPLGVRRRPPGCAARDGREIWTSCVPAARLDPRSIPPPGSSFFETPDRPPATVSTGCWAARWPPAMRCGWKCSPARATSSTCRASADSSLGQWRSPLNPPTMTRPPRSIACAAARAKTVRRMMDCLIAAVAIRADAAVLHNDSDFDTLARHAGLKVDRHR